MSASLCNTACSGLEDDDCVEEKVISRIRDSGMKSWRSKLQQALATLGFLALGLALALSLKPSQPTTALTDLETRLIAEAAGVPQILGTRIRGEAAVRQFRSSVACFSESGRWQLDNTPRRIPWNIAGDPFASQCDERHLQTNPGINVAFEKADEAAARGKNWTVREELKWTWQTNSSCPMLRFNRTEICVLIGPRRNILIVGDSINHEMQWSFLNHLVENRTQTVASLSSVRSWRGDEVCADILGGSNGFRVGWIRNDRLSQIEHECTDTISNFYEWPWVKYLEEWDIKILLLNRGAHYEDDGVFVQALNDTFAFLQSQYPHLVVFYRNTPPGHLNCADYNHPIDKRQQLDMMSESWHWWDFQAQNLLAKEIVEKVGYIYMDVDNMLSLRPDGHIGSQDCLHYCLPGPLDVIMHLFYNTFLILV